jgi:phosphatidate cytidylyltransferase
MEWLQNPVLFRAWCGVGALLASATLIAWLFHRARPSPETKRTKVRIRTWWLIAGSLFAAMAGGVPGMAVIFLLVSLLALREFVFLDARAQRRGPVFLVLATGAVFYFSGLVVNSGRLPIWIQDVAALLAMGLCLVIVTGAGKAAALALAAFLFGVMGIGFVVRLAQVTGEGEARTEMGLRLCFFLLLLTSLNDVAQYLWGKGMGRRKIVPRISPNKTWAGLIGGVLTTALLAGIMAPWFTPFGWERGVIVGLLLGIGGFLGDIMVSAYKRSVGVGDSGAILPGHGGILDRIDSLCVTAPLLYGLVFLN